MEKVGHADWEKAKESQKQMFRKEKCVLYPTFLIKLPTAQNQVLMWNWDLQTKASSWSVVLAHPCVAGLVAPFLSLETQLEEEL